METVRKSDFVEFISKQHKISKADAERSISYFIDSIGKILAKGKKISFVGFGNFYTLKTKARSGRNPKTGLPIKIKASNRPAFKAGLKLKELCNK